jgi:hypothetical protein
MYVDGELLSWQGDIRLAEDGKMIYRHAMAIYLFYLRDSNDSWKR